ncbi:MAG: DUF952 domain-containing protein [bacterium]|nr:DUF952 domain-containing protein [bacterium]
MIYHITRQDDWLNAQSTGEYRADSLQTQGFIHFSKATQVEKVANAVYQGLTGLVLLVVDPDKVTSDLRHEPPDTSIPAENYLGETYPHLYGPLNVDAVVETRVFAADEDGKFRFRAAE